MSVGAKDKCLIWGPCRHPDRRLLRLPVRLSLLFSSRDVRREALNIAVQHRDVMRGKGGTIKAITERVSPRVSRARRVISNARPIIRNDPGEIAEGVYTVVADKAVEVWDLQGRLLGTEVLRPGDGADAVARKILREKSGKRNSFYDAIVYPRWAI